MTTQPAAGISRRDFFRLSAALLGGAALADVLPAAGPAVPPVQGAATDALTLENDLSGWLDLFWRARDQRARGLDVPLPEPAPPFAEFFERGEEVFRSAPGLRALAFNNAPGGVVGVRLDVARLTAWPHLARIESLTFLGCGLGPEGLRVLAASPHVGNLRRLVIMRDDLFDEGAAVLAGAPNLGELRDLLLLTNHIGPQGARALAGSTRLARLETLDLLCNPIGDAGAHALAAARLPSLTNLGLYDNGIGPAGGRALAASRLPRLRSVALHLQQVGPEAAEALRRRFGDGLSLEHDHPERAAEDARVRAVAAAPDDGPRRRYADRLAAADPARAELIRLQCAVAATPAHGPRRHEREHLSKNLLAAHGDRWLEPLDRVVPYVIAREEGQSLDDFLAVEREARPRYEFRRGFVERAALATRRFACYAGDLLRAVPTVRSARIQFGLDRPEWDARAVASPRLAGLTELELVDFDEKTLARLARSPYLKRLRTLRLRSGVLARAALQALLVPGRTPQLSRLHLLHCPGAEALAGLAGSEGARRLTHLELAGGMDHDALTDLLAAPWPALTSLTLTATPDGEGLAERLARAPFLASLRALDLSGTCLDAAGAEVLAQAAGLAGLRELRVNHNPLGDEGAAALARSPHLAGLKLLNLAHAELGAPAAVALAGSPHLRELAWLDLGENGLGDEGAAALAGARWRLNDLEVNRNGLTADGVAALARAPLLGGVTDLLLWGNPLGDA
jgi:Ran GTPase-activating protein (RanGAP) involved in mRNA processing and transport